MARPLRISYPGAFYHVTSRGNERKAVFKSSGDREKFLGYLASASQRYDARVHAYCLMDNHYHLLLQTPRANLPEIMHHINGAYTTYFNVKRARSGHLFQGRYKALLLDADSYLLKLVRYVHLNPVRQVSSFFLKNTAGADTMLISEEIPSHGSLPIGCCHCSPVKSKRRGKDAGRS